MKKPILIICAGLLAMLIMLMFKRNVEPAKAAEHDSVLETNKGTTVHAGAKTISNAQNLKRYTAQSVPVSPEQIYGPKRLPDGLAEINRCASAEGILGSNFIKTPQGQKLTLLLLENGYDIEYIWPVFKALENRDNRPPNTFQQTPEQVIRVQRIYEQQVRRIVETVDGMPGIRPDVAEQIIALKITSGFGWPSTDPSKIGRWTPPAILLTKQDLTNYIYANPAGKDIGISTENPIPQAK
jgi:hypothetical protein